MPHLLNSCDPLFGPQPSSTCHPLITHPDGTLVKADNPARVGEIITLYAVGYACTWTGGPTAQGNPCGDVIFEFPYPLPPETPVTTRGLIPLGPFASTKQAVQPDWVGTVSGFTGLYQANVRVPPAPGGVQPCSAGSGFLHLPVVSGFVRLVGPTADPVPICVQP